MRWRVIGFLLLLASSTAFGATMDENLAAYARSLVSTVSNNHLIHAWHWETQQAAFEGQDPRLPVTQRVMNHLHFQKDTFTRAQGFGVAGPGLYFAMDPESSSAFGSLRFTDTPAWILVQAVISPGVRFIDEAKDKGIAAFSSELATQMKAAGCDVDNAQRIFQRAATSDFTPQPGQPPLPVDPVQVACLSIRKKILDFSFDPRDPRRRTVSGMKYPFTAAQLDGCGPKSKFAFMLFGDDAIGFDHVVIFTPDVPSPDDGHNFNRIMIQDIFVKAGHPIDPWPALAGLTSAPQLDIAQWMKDHIVNCVPGRFPEDANPPEIPTP